MQAILQKAPTAARLFFGLLFVVFGLNGFLQFMPLPEPPPAAGAFLGGLASAGYFFPLLKGTEVLAGVLLLLGRFVPLALVLLAPIVVQIAAYHFFLTPGDVGLAVVLLAGEAYLAWAWRDAFRGLFTTEASPSPQPSRVPGARPAAHAA